MSENEVEAVLQSMRFGDVIYWHNRVPYIRRLEFEGWSNQAPSGFLRHSIDEARRTVEGTRFV